MSRPRPAAALLTLCALCASPVDAARAAMTASRAPASQAASTSQAATAPQAASTSQAPPTKRVRRYNAVPPTVYPGAKVAFPQFASWPKGTAHATYAAGTVYVFEFFSTTCSHCHEAAPIVLSLVEEFAPQGFVFVGVTDEDEAKVRAWLEGEEAKEFVQHSIACDPAKSAQKTLQDGTYQVLSPRMFAVKDGVVLWYGHPEIAREPLAKIAAGTWNPESIRQEFVTNALIARAKNQTSSLVTQCEKDGDWVKAFELFESIAAAFPEQAATFELQKFGTMIGPADQPLEGYAYGRELAVKYANDIASLRTLARTTLNVPAVRVRDLDFAFAVARAADMLGKGEDARAAEVLALAHFSRGDRESAIAAQERAIRLQENAKLKRTYEQQLEKYRKDDPKPVPYTPRPKPNAAGAGANTPANTPGGAPVNAPASTGGSM
jgi:thiol-disulfide isomerase/thioredoxin